MTDRGSGHISVSVIIPAYNARRTIGCCLDALLAELDRETEIIVVDDGSTDGTPALAERPGVELVRLTRNLGPGPARNRGASRARGEIFLFLDADVAVPAGTLERVRRFFRQHPRRSAVFGSYDSAPAAVSLVSQFRNLLHHFTHQSGQAFALHFFTGIGAVRRDEFFAAGGFDETRYARACEDVEFGYRFCAQGYAIHVDKRLQATHLKRWTLGSMIRTDFWLRAVPWVRLMSERHIVPPDLALNWKNRLNLAAVNLMALGIVLSILYPVSLNFSAVVFLLFFFINWEMWRFFHRARGLLFSLCCIPLYVLYNLNIGAALAYALATFPRERQKVALAARS